MSETDPPLCPRDHWKWGRDMPMDRLLTAGGGWECPGIRPDRSGDCGFTIGVAPAPEPPRPPAREFIRALYDLADELDPEDGPEPRWSARHVAMKIRAIAREAATVPSPSRRNRGRETL